MLLVNRIGALRLPIEIFVDRLPLHAIVRVVFTAQRQLALRMGSFQRKEDVKICYDLAVYANEQIHIK